MLAAEAVHADPSLNFLRSDRLAAIAEHRISQSVGTVEADRLRRNLLSSQPLAVNLFGPLLAADPAGAAAALAPALHVDMDRVTDVRIEWSPEPASEYLNDRTAFDVYFEYQRNDGARGFVAVETKYTDSFSPDTAIRASELKMTKYRNAALALGEYDVAKIDGLFHRNVSQLFRMTLLASMWRVAGHFDFGVCLVAALDEDGEAIEAVERLGEAHVNASHMVRHRTHDELVKAIGLVAESPAWGLEFTHRYLDTNPINN